MPRLSEARREWLTTMMKETIFEAATSVLCEHGVHGTTMNRVAAAAKIAKSSLYDYFRSKEDLLRFVCGRIAEPIVQAAEEVAEADLPATEKLEAIVRTVFEHLGTHQALLGPLLWDDQFREAMESSREIARAKFFQHLVAVFEQGMDEGAFRSIDAAQTTRVFAACLIDFCENQVASGKGDPVDRQVEALMRLFLHGISTDAGRPDDA